MSEWVEIELPATIPAGVTVWMQAIPGQRQGIRYDAPQKVRTVKAFVSVPNGSPHWQTMDGGSVWLHLPTLAADIDKLRRQRCWWYRLRERL